MILKLRRKPAEVEAVLWDGSADTANSFVGDRYGTDWCFTVKFSGPPGSIAVATPRGWMMCRPGDYILRHASRVWVCEAEAVDELYEPVKE